MSEQDKEVVNEEARQAEVESTATETEQDTTVSEDVQNTESDGKDYKTLYENSRKAVIEKNRIIHELKRADEESETEGTDDEGVKRFLRTEADAYLTKKAMLDPNFKDLIPAIEALVEKGIDVRTAEQTIKVQMFDNISSQISKNEKGADLNQIRPSATPEEKVVNDAKMEDILSGKVQVSEEERLLIEALERNV
jgi:hypothetical protein